MVTVTNGRRRREEEGGGCVCVHTWNHRYVDMKVPLMAASDWLLFTHVTVSTA